MAHPFRSAHLDFFDLARDAINKTVRGRAECGVTTFAHMCYGYANAVTGKRVNPELPGALARLASTHIDAISLEYAQPGHQPDVFWRWGTRGWCWGPSTAIPPRQWNRPKR